MPDGRRLMPKTTLKLSKAFGIVFGVFGALPDLSALFRVFRRAGKRRKSGTEVRKAPKSAENDFTRFRPFSSAVGY
eukprot:13991917-Alexandrium_andersonii.AAC.1